MVNKLIPFSIAEASRNKKRMTSHQNQLQCTMLGLRVFSFRESVGYIWEFLVPNYIHSNHCNGPFSLVHYTKNLSPWSFQLGSRFCRLHVGLKTYPATSARKFSPKHFRLFRIPRSLFWTVLRKQVGKHKGRRFQCFFWFSWFLKKKNGINQKKEMSSWGDSGF